MSYNQCTVPGCGGYAHKVNSRCDGCEIARLTAAVTALQGERDEWKARRDGAMSTIEGLRADLASAAEKSQRNADRAVELAREHEATRAARDEALGALREVLDTHTNRARVGICSVRDRAWAVLASRGQKT
jgi:hypothetical protein